jgi:hypothetical protein
MYNMSLALLHHSNLLAAAGDVMRALEAARKADSIRRAVVGHEHRQTMQSSMQLAKLHASELHDHRCVYVRACVRACMRACVVGLRRSLHPSS